MRGRVIKTVYYSEQIILPIRVGQSGVPGGLITHRSEEADGKAAAEFKSSLRYFLPIFFQVFKVSRNKSNLTSP